MKLMGEIGPLDRNLNELLMGTSSMAEGELAKMKD